SFGPRNKRDYRLSVLPRGRNRSPHAGCRSPHSKSRHRATRRPDARHSSDRKLVAARRQVSGRATNAISFSSVRSLFLLHGRLRHSQVVIAPRCAQLRGDLLWLRVRVAEQHPWITMAANHRNLWNIQAPLKKSADSFMSKIMEAQLQNTGSSSQSLPCEPERIGGNSKHGGTAARHVLDHITGSC